jgi:dsRNA-specific ribonuclease
MFNISQKAFGLGDAIVGLYAIEAIKQKYPNRQINYYSRFNNWIK